MDYSSPATAVPTDPLALRAVPPNRELNAAQLALLGELAASLQSSHQAVLTRDVAALNLATADQVRLRHALEILLKPPPDDGEHHKPRDHAFDPQVIAAAARVLHLARVQGALLRRAQQFLSVLAHFAAGPGTTYGELISARYRFLRAAARMPGAPLPAETSSANEESPCRV